MGCSGVWAPALHRCVGVLKWFWTCGSKNSTSPALPSLSHTQPTRPPKTPNTLGTKTVSTMLPKHVGRCTWKAGSTSFHLLGCFLCLGCIPGGGLGGLAVVWEGAKCCWAFRGQRWDMSGGFVGGSRGSFSQTRRPIWEKQASPKVRREIMERFGERCRSSVEFMSNQRRISVEIVSK